MTTRFKDTPTVIFQDQEMPGHWVLPDILKRVLTDVEVTYYRVTNSTAGKPATIAHEVYGNSQLDWLVIAASQATQVFGWPIAGTLLRLPSSTLVYAELL